MNRCKAHGFKDYEEWQCSALWRVWYPFGRKSKPVIKFLVKHHKNCVHNESVNNDQRRDCAEISH